jgi:hypothetical protein
MTWRPTLQNGGRRYRLSAYATDTGNGFVLDEIETGEHRQWSDFETGEDVQILPVHGESHHLPLLQDPDFAPGKRLQLYWEPNNPFDRNAISIRNHLALTACGYAPRELAATIARRLGQGATPLTFSMWQEIVDGTRVSLRILIDWAGLVEPPA